MYRGSLCVLRVVLTQSLRPFQAKGSRRAEHMRRLPGRLMPLNLVAAEDKVFLVREDLSEPLADSALTMTPTLPTFLSLVNPIQCDLFILLSESNQCEQNVELGSP